MVIPITYEIWAFPFRLAFCSFSPSENLIDTEDRLVMRLSNNPTLWSDIICDLVFVVDAFLVRLSTSWAPESPENVGGNVHELTSFQELSHYYFRNVFALDMGPAILYYSLTAALPAVRSVDYQVLCSPV